MEPDSPTDEDKKPKQDEGKNYLHTSLLCRRISVRKGRDIFKSSKQSKVLWNTIKPLLPKGRGKCSIHKRRKEGYGLGNYSLLVSIYLVLHISLLLSFSTADEDLKFILLKRPKISIVANYKINTKAAHNHFQRYSDVKAKGQCKLPHDFCEFSLQPFFVMLRNL